MQVVYDRSISGAEVGYKTDGEFSLYDDSGKTGAWPAIAWKIRFYYTDWLKFKDLFSKIKAFSPLRRHFCSQLVMIFRHKDCRGHYFLNAV